MYFVGSRLLNRYLCGEYLRGIMRHEMGLSNELSDERSISTNIERFRRTAYIPLNFTLDSDIYELVDPIKS